MEMEKVLGRLAAPFKNIDGLEEDPENLWADIEDLNDGQLLNLTEAVENLRQTAGVETDDEESKSHHDEDEEGTDNDDEDIYDEDGLNINDLSNFEELDPEEQLRLLMQPVEDDSGFSDGDVENDEDGDEYDEEDGELDGKKKVSFDILNEDESEDEAVPQSNFEKQQARLKRTIVQMEADNIAEKDWTLRGEVNATHRPVDSLLQEDLEFEHLGKLAPVVTVEVTESIESIIKKRIKDAAWDDVERIPEDLAIEQKKKAVVELKDTKSKQSLAEQYEAEFQAKQKQQKKHTLNPSDLKDDANVDPETKAKHDEIRKLFGKLCKAIDELSENKFAPRAYETAEVEIKTLKN